MIGDGWDGDPAVRPATGPVEAPRRRRVAVVTGTRAEFGLLAPVMRAVRDHPELELLVIACGSHLVSPAESFREVKAQFEVADSVPMQIAGRIGRLDDVEAVGRGVSRFGRSFGGLRPDWVVVLGDRIEAFAAATAASIGGFALAHLHGGDRAEGVADEAMRHAITKLAHLHLAATEESADRIVRMGEPRERVQVIGSPALDDLPRFEPLGDEAWAAMGSPRAVFLMHPVGRSDEAEEASASAVLAALADRPVLALSPNLDPGRRGVARAIESAGVRTAEHLPRERFVGLLKRLGASGGVLVGNSSAGLIEAAALRVPAVDVGPRQNGREHAGNVVRCAERTEAVAAALRAAERLDLSAMAHPFGDGRSGVRAAAAIARTEPDARLLRKRCTY